MASSSPTACERSRKTSNATFTPAWIHFRSASELTGTSSSPAVPHTNQNANLLSSTTLDRLKEVFLRLHETLWRRARCQPQLVRDLTVVWRAAAGETKALVKVPDQVVLFRGHIHTDESLDSGASGRRNEGIEEELLHGTV